MSVKLRLTRMGRKKLPFYRIVAVDSRVRRDGKYLEKIGHYNPISDPVEIVIDRAKAFKWLDRGAIPSDTVSSMLKKEGILLEWDLIKRGLDKEKIQLEIEGWQAKQQDRVKRDEAVAAMEQREKEKLAAKAKEEAEKAAKELEAAKSAAAAAEESATEAASSDENAGV